MSACVGCVWECVCVCVCADKKDAQNNLVCVVGVFWLEKGEL